MLGVEIEGSEFISKSNSSEKNSMSLSPFSVATNVYQLLVPITSRVLITHRDGPITDNV